MPLWLFASILTGWRLLVGLHAVWKARSGVGATSKAAALLRDSTADSEVADESELRGDSPMASRRPMVRVDSDGELLGSAVQ